MREEHEKREREQREPGIPRPAAAGAAVPVGGFKRSSKSAWYALFMNECSSSCACEHRTSTCMMNVK